MSVEVPFPRADVLLLGALPGVWLLGRALTYALTRDRGLRRVLPIGVALVVWLSAVHAASLAAHSLVTGLPVATILVALAGGLAERRRHRGESTLETGALPSRAMWISMGLTAALVAPAALRFWFHDELGFTGHMSTVAQMQNGIYPPRHLALPSVPFRYHYGFDLLSACLTALFRVQVDRAIDLATLGLWCASWCLLWVLGERLVGRRGAWLTPALSLFAGGIPLACDRPGPSLWCNAVVECGVGAQSLNAPVASYFFQHPWALGIPIATTIALLLSERDPANEAVRLFVLGLSLALLSLSEITLFVAVLPAAIVAEATNRTRFELRRGMWLLGLSVLVVCAAKLAGGFFVPVPSAPMRFRFHAGFADSLAATLVWNAKTFGLSLPLGVAGFFLLQRGRIFYGLLAAGSIVVLNGVRYQDTDDIRKFATVASIALGVLGSVALAHLFEHRSPLQRWAAAALTGTALAEGVAFLVAFLLGVHAIPSATRREPERLSQQEIDAMTFVRHHATAGDLVYHERRGAEGWTQWGGIPLAQRSWTDRAFGLPTDRLYTNDVLLSSAPSAADRYRAQGFVWFVLDGDGGAVGHAADDWLQSGEAHEAARFGSLRIVELSPS